MALKTALITGGSRGIGAGVARALARDGWRVVLSGRADSEKGRETASALGATFLPADLREEAQVQLVETYAKHTGLWADALAGAEYERTLHFDLSIFNHYARHL